MRLNFRFYLNWFLVAAFCVNPLYPALAQQNNLSPRAQAAAGEAQEFQALLKASEQLPAGQPKGTFAPDRFLLLEQQVYQQSRVGRAFSFFSTPAERELEEHRYRLDQARKVHDKIKGLLAGQTEIQNPCLPYSAKPEFGSEFVRENLVKHLNGGRATKDTPLFVWNSKDKPQELACLEERVRGVIWDWNYKLTDLFVIRKNLTEVPNVTGAPIEIINRYYNWWDLTLGVKSLADDELFENIKLQRTADGHSIDTSNTFACKDQDCSFELKIGKQRLHHFKIPVKAITTFGPYVVFVHSQSYDTQSGVQYLSFLDLAQFGPAIGRAEIPVFRLPVTVTNAATSLEVRNKNLVINGTQEIAIEAFMAASEIQQAAFNISANLSDPGDIADVVPYIDGLQTYFEKVMKAQIEDAANDGRSSKRAEVLMRDLGEGLHKQIVQNQKLNQLAGKDKTKLNPQELAELSVELRKSLDEYDKNLESSRAINERMSRVSQRLSGSRGIKARVEALFSRLTSPVPNGSLKLKRALVMVGAFRSHGQGEFMKFLLDRPYLSSFVMAAGLMAAASPESFVQLAESSIALGNGIFDYSKFALLGLGEAFAKGTAATLSPLADFGSTFYAQYVDKGNLARTLIGLGFFVPFILSLYFIPHLIFNLHKIYLDSRKPDWQGFVNHQQDFVREYYDRLAQDEAKRRKIAEPSEAASAVEFSAEEEAEIREFLAKRKSQSAAFRAPGFLSRAWKSTTAGLAKLKSAVGLSKLKSETWSAITSVVFSYPAMELSLGRWVKFWNWFSGARYTTVGFLTLRDVGLKYNFPIFIRPKPISAAVRLTFPDFFTTVVAKGGQVPGSEKHKVTVPTALNGGTRLWGLRDLIWLKESLFGKPSAVQAAENEMARELTLSELKGLTENFEKEIMQVEEEVFQVAFRSALRRLPEFMTDKDELKELFQSEPLKTPFEKRVRTLPAKVRTFLRLHFEQVYAATMSEYLQKELNRIEADHEESLDISEIKNSMSLSRLKSKFIQLRKENQSREGFAFNKNEAARIAEKHGMDPRLFERVAQQARKGEMSLGNWVTNRKYNLIGDMDPKQNGSMERYATVQERIKSPNALSRAVRAEISKLLITFPLDLAFKMVLSAGVFEGAFKPIQQEMLGDNSIFYLSRDSFYMITAAGFVMSMMADAWVKIQQDARQDDMGDFGQIPQGEDAERGFFRWYMKQYNAKNNSLLSNWAFSNKISFWNMPAALVNIGLFSFVFSGRFDLSYLLAGYVVTFATPMSAFLMKVDQAFERSVDYAARGIKEEKWMAHPEVQEMIAHERQYYRNRFQWLNDIYGNIQGNWIVNVEMIPTSYGTRGFVRSLFGGYLVEEALIEKVFQPATQMTDGIPVVGKVVKTATKACEHLLTNGNTDIRLKK